MAICPNEHFDTLLLALRDQDREYAMILLAELLTWLVVPCNPLPQSRSFAFSAEAIDTAVSLIRGAAARQRAQAIDVPTIAEQRRQSAQALDDLANGLIPLRRSIDSVLSD